jgi:hypothetical protein
MFTSGVTSTDDDAIDILFGSKTPGADNLLGGTNQDSNKTAVDPKSKEDANTAAAAKNKDGKSDTDTNANSNAVTDNELIDTLFGDVDTTQGDGNADSKQDTPQSTQKKNDSKKKDSTLPDSMEVNFEAMYNEMVRQNIWEEVELPEGREWDRETFLEVQKLQATSKYEDLLSKTGPYGKAIIQFEQNGGNPGELLNLFREQREVQQFDISSPDGQEQFLREYLQAQEYSDKSIDRLIKALTDQGGEALKEEAEEKKALWDTQYNEAIESRKRDQALESQRVKEAQDSFKSNIEDTLTKDGDVTPKERKDLQGYILNYSQSYQGRNVSQFYVDMAEVQRDPKNYIELAKFVRGLKDGNYTQKIADKTKKSATVESYLKIKGGTALKTNGGSNPDLTNNKGSNFITLLNKK